MNFKRDFIILLSAIQLQISAQNKTSIYLTSGASIPLGDYGSTEIVSPFRQPSQFAAIGLSFNLGIDLPIYKFIGLSSQIGYQTNVYDAESNAINQNLNFGYPYYRKVEADNPYTNLNVMVGPYANIRVLEKLSVQPSLMYGISRLNVPSLYFEYSFELWNRLFFDPVTSFGYKLSLKTQYQLSNHFGLIANISYSRFDGIFEVSYNNKLNSTKIHATEMPINIITINPNLGLSYQL